MKANRQKARRAEPRLYVEGSAASLIGSRERQEDCVRLPGGAVSGELLARRGYLAVLCDGMGGLKGGNIAAELCAETLMSMYYGEEEQSPLDFYQSALPGADRAVADLADDDGVSLLCGTTLASVIVYDRRLYWASVGDSRIYLFRQGSLRRLSRDHNYLLCLTKAYQEGQISELEMLSDDRARALISYIGMNGLQLKDISEEDELLEAGDMVMLCSDGLYQALRDDEIEAVFKAWSGRPEALPELLTQMACERDWMAHDNVTAAVVAIRYEQVSN